MQAGIFAKFKEALVEETKKLKPADPAEADTKMGAIVSKEHMEKILSYIELAVEEGGQVLTGGTREIWKAGVIRVTS